MVLSQPVFSNFKQFILCNLKNHILSFWERVMLFSSPSTSLCRGMEEIHFFKNVRAIKGSIRRGLPWWYQLTIYTKKNWDKWRCVNITIYKRALTRKECCQMCLNLVKQFRHQNDSYSKDPQLFFLTLLFFYSFYFFFLSIFFLDRVSV